MPTPDGREWLTPNEIMTRIYASLKLEFPALESFLDTPEKRDRARNAIKLAFLGTGYNMELKCARMFEKVRDALRAGNFGPIDETQNKNIYDLYQTVKTIFSVDFMDGIDDDGNPIP
jgi:hypothetical protein